MRAFRWTPVRRQAAELLAHGLTQKEVATRLFIHRNTVANLLKRVEFRHRVERRFMQVQTDISLRRTREVVALTDRAERAACAALSIIERDEAPTPDALRGVMAVLRLFRKQLRDEQQVLAPIRP